jgi:uncharacterized membrane protein YdjX (TVP38/TMEM64 family)
MSGGGAAPQAARAEARAVPAAAARPSSRSLRGAALRAAPPARRRPARRGAPPPGAAPRRAAAAPPPRAKSGLKGTLDAPPPDDDDRGAGHAGALASLAAAAGLAAVLGGAYLARGQVAAALDGFSLLIDAWGPWGYAAYVLVYAALELLAVPAIPLTMTAGALFGVVPGAALVSVAATAAATGAFLIARYVARDRVAAWAAGDARFAAIDRAIGRDGFRVVALLRLSPLLPLAASNYLYGLTSVELPAYVLGSWLGMLPGTVAYVAAGTYGRELFEGGSAGGGLGAQLADPATLAQLGGGLAASAAAVWYVTRLARAALEEAGEG